MKILLYISTIMLSFFNPTLITAYQIEDEVNNALKMMRNNDPTSFNILNKICTETNNEAACLGVGYCYMYGIGTNFKVDEANKIFNSLIDSKDKNISQDAKACLALLYENGIVNSETLDIASSIWKDLLNSENNNIVNMAKNNLYALNLNIVATNIIQSMILFGCGKISFDDLRNYLNDKQLNTLPKNIFNAYIEWRTAFFDSYKSNSDQIKQLLMNISNGLIKGLLKDPSLITDLLRSQEKADNEQLIAQRADQLWINFIGILQNEGVQEMWLDYAQIEAIGFCKRNN